MHILYKQNNIVLGLLITTSGADARIQGKVHMLGNTTLVILNNKIFYILQIFRALEDFAVPLAGTFHQKSTRKKRRILKHVFRQTSRQSTGHHLFTRLRSPRRRSCKEKNIFIVSRSIKKQMKELKDQKTKQSD